MCLMRLRKSEDVSFSKVHFMSRLDVGSAMQPVEGRRYKKVRSVNTIPVEQIVQLFV